MKFACFMLLTALNFINHEHNSAQASTVIPFAQCSTLYTSQHEIIRLTLLHSDNKWDYYNNTDISYTLLFVEVELDGEKITEYEGLYRYRNGEVKKLLDKGTCAVASKTEPIAYIGTTSGIFIYNDKYEILGRYGTNDDNILNINIADDPKVLYVLTKEHKIHKVDESGRKTAPGKDRNYSMIMFDTVNSYHNYGPNGESIMTIEDGVEKYETRNLTDIMLYNPYFADTNAELDDDFYHINENGIAMRVAEKISTKPPVKSIMGIAWDNKIRFCSIYDK